MQNTTHLDFIPATDGLRLYEVSIAYVEARTEKRRVIGTHVCGAANAQEAIDLAHEELWVEPYKSSGDASDQQCQELDRYLSCPAMTGEFVEGGAKLRWTLDRVTGMLVDADALESAAGFKWLPLSDDERAELQAYLEDTDAESAPADCGAFAARALPDWSAAAPKPPAPTGDLWRFLLRRHQSGRGPAA